jgi:hypothetical protein
MATAVVLEDGSGVTALRGGIGRQLKIAAVALDGGGGRRTCNDGIGISAVKAEGLLFQRLRQHWQGWQERTRPMQGTYVGSNAKEVGVLRWRLQCGSADMTIALKRQGQGDDGTGPAQARQGQCDDGVTTKVTRERENS